MALQIGSNVQFPKLGTGIVVAIEADGYVCIVLDGNGSTIKSGHTMSVAPVEHLFSAYSMTICTDPYKIIELTLIRRIREEYKNRFFMGVCCGANVYAAIASLRSIRAIMIMKGIS